MARLESQGRGILSSHGARPAAAGEARGLRHDAPRREPVRRRRELSGPGGRRDPRRHARGQELDVARRPRAPDEDRKSTRLNSSHGYISYAVFCLKKKNKNTEVV